MWSNLRSVDEKYTAEIDNCERPYFDQSFGAITSLGSPQLSVLFIIALILIGQVQNSLLIGGSILVSWLIIYPLKVLVGRKRPEDSDGNFLIPESFPSGHSGTAFAAATALTHIYSKAFFFVFLACSVAFSRVYLDDHYFSDIIVGSLLGVLSGVVVIQLLI